MFTFTKKRVGWFIVASFIALFAAQLTALSTVRAATGTLDEYGVKDRNKVEDAIDYAEWIDAANIKLVFKNTKSLTFKLSKDENGGGSSSLPDARFKGTSTNIYYGSEEPSLPCFASLQTDNPSGGSVAEIQKTLLTAVRVDIDFKVNDFSVDCEDGNEPVIPVLKKELSIAYFKWTAPNQISDVALEKPGSFTKDDGGAIVTVGGVKYEVFKRDSEGSVDKCQDLLLLDRPNNTIMWYELDSKYDGDTPNEVNSVCNYNKSGEPASNVRWQLANTSDSVAEIPPSTGQPTDGTTNNGEKSCVDAFDTFGIIVCWVLSGIDQMLSLIEETLKSLLEVDTGTFTASGDNENGDRLYDAWRGVVSVSSALLAIVAMTMIIGTALGGYKAFNAYTVKTVLPRIVIAAIAMWLSWALVTAYIGAMNTIGRGIADLMWEPFSSRGTFEDYGLKEVFIDASSDTDRPAETIAGIGMVGFIASGALATGGAWALLTTLSPVLLFMLVGFIVLILRQSIIVFLIIVAPFAIVSWVLPNTKVVWDKWSKFLNQLLFMFPIFMAILAAGKIFAYISAQTNSTGPLSILIPIIAYVTPFALLPGIFKSAGGALSKVTGTVSKLGSKATAKPQKVLQGYADAAQARKKKEGDQRLYGRANSGSSLAQFQLRARSGQNILGRSFSPSSTRREARNSQMEASRAVMQEAFDKQQLEEAETALRRGAIKDSSGSSIGYNSADSLLSLAQDSGSTEAQKRAALNRLTQLKATTQLETARTHFNAGGVWARHQDSNYSAMKEFAPQLVNSSFQDASAEAASKWTRETWRAAAASDPGAASRLAYDVSTNDKLKSSIGYETMQEIKSIAGTATPSGTQQTSAEIDIPHNTSNTNTAPNGAPTTPQSVESVRLYSRETWGSMGHDNAQKAVTSRGGFGVINEADLLSIANEYGGQVAGEAAKTELKKRGLLTEESGIKRPLP